MHCLVVDPNIGFAQLLSEELTRLGHGVATCTTARQAVQAVRKQKPGLAFLDMTLSGPDALTLAKALRQFDTNVRLVLIPLMGQQTVDHNGLAVQGILPKPFFLPELPERIDAALAAPLDGSAQPTYVAKEQNLADLLPEDTHPVEQERKPMSMDGEIVVRVHERDPNRRDETNVIYEGGLDDESEQESAGEVIDTGIKLDPEPVTASIVEEREAPVPPAVAIPDVELEMEGGLNLGRYDVNKNRIERLLVRLVDGVQADGAVLCHRGDMLQYTGNLQQDEAASVGTAVYQGWITSVQVARALGQEQIRFEQSIEGGTYLLYALSVASDAIMTVVMRNTRSLGLLRFNARETAAGIAQLCETY